MADSFGLKIGLEGEKEFKKALADINQSFKVLGSEMKLATSQFDKNDKSVEALAARNKVLRKEIDEQTTKIDTLRKALQNAAPCRTEKRLRFLRRERPPHPELADPAEQRRSRPQRHESGAGRK